MKKRAFYPVSADDLVLPERHIKAYMLGSSFEYSRTSREEKIDHLAYAVAHGYDIWKEMEEAEMPTSMLNWTLAAYVTYMRYGNYHEVAEVRAEMQQLLALNMSVEALYELFLAELHNYVTFTENEDEIEFTHRDLGWGIYIKRPGDIYCPSVIDEQ